MGLTDVVSRQLEAYNQHDLEAFLSCYHEDVVVKEVHSRRIVCQGMQSFRELYSSLFAKSPELHCNLVARHIYGVTVVDHEEVSGINGRNDVLHTCAVYVVDDGLIREVWFTDKKWV